MRRSFLTFLMAGVLAAGVLIGTTVKEGSATAAAHGAAKCSNASLHGAYGVSFDGNSQTLGHVASVSLWKFDGKGKMRASEKFNTESTGPQGRSITGSYKVGRDCRFQLSFGSELVKPHQVDGQCVLVARHKQFSCLDFEEGWQSVAIGTKVSG